MAEKDEAPQFNPKHRIIGAIIIVALAVILVPLVLDERDTPSELKGITEIPSERQNANTQVVVTPVGELGKDAPRGKEGDKAASDEQAVPARSVTDQPLPGDEPGPVKSETAPAPARTTIERSTVKTSAKTASPGERISKGWVVQVGVYANADNAARLRDKLRGEGLSVSEERITLDGGKAVRLRVGPYADRAAALKAQARIQKDTGVKGVVLAYP